MSDFIKWWNHRNKNSEHMLDDINQMSERVCKLAFNAGAAAQIEKDGKITDRLETLAVKWVAAGHHDWAEIKDLIVQRAAIRAHQEK